MRYALPLLLAMALLPATARAFESPDPPDYKAIFQHADLVVQANVIDVVLSSRLSRPTKVTLKVNAVLKGDVEKGETIRIFHESGEAVTRPLLGRSSTIHAFRCPAFPQFYPGESVRLYAKWDGKKKRLIVPGHRWKVTLTP